jgi:hypothetical protein
MGFEGAILAVTASFPELCEVSKAWKIATRGKDLFVS